HGSSRSHGIRLGGSVVFSVPRAKRQWYATLQATLARRAKFNASQSELRNLPGATTQRMNAYCGTKS
ncbi:MAG: hypothetical protein KDA47_21330, partial [Planctomycetales bacterium]|nr:hypothetical protein [Planctomycetales bacterium]